VGGKGRGGWKGVFQGRGEGAIVVCFVLFFFCGEGGKGGVGRKGKEKSEPSLYHLYFHVRGVERKGGEDREKIQRGGRKTSLSPLLHRTTEKEGKSFKKKKRQGRLACTARCTARGERGRRKETKRTKVGRVVSFFRTIAITKKGEEGEEKRPGEREGT